LTHYFPFFDITLSLRANNSGTCSVSIVQWGMFS